VSVDNVLVIPIGGLWFSEPQEVFITMDQVLSGLSTGDTVRVVGILMHKGYSAYKYIMITGLIIDNTTSIRFTKTP